MASEIKVDTIVNAGGDNDSGIDLSTNDEVVIKTANTERVKVDASGVVTVDRVINATTSADPWLKGVDSGGTETFFVKPNGTLHADSNVLIGTTSTSATTEAGVILKPDGGLHMNNSTTSGGISLILLYSSYSTTDQTKFEVTSEGNVKSRTNSYAGFSDERLKEQIVDASSQWDDIKAIEIKNFKFISDLDDADNPKMLGVIAQQVEQVSPSLVEVDPKDDMKTVKYSLLYLKAVKALQEAMARIETLEAKVTALESE